MMDSRTQEDIPRILVLQPDANCGPAQLRTWAQRAGVVLDVRDAREAPHLAGVLSDADGLVVLGGHMGDGDTAEFPWLEDLRALLRRAHEKNQPTLGICLGAQLLAAALGGTVRLGGAGLETGVVHLRATPHAAGDPVLQGLGGGFVSGAMHQDAVTELPPGATLLATGDTYPNQMFRTGASWGVQFHPEIGAEEYAAWKAPVCDGRPGFEEEFDRTVAEFFAQEEAVASGCGRLVRNFFEVVREARAGGSGLRNSAASLRP